MSAESGVGLTYSEARKIAIILNSVVVSLDQMGGKIDSVEECDAETAKFIGPAVRETLAEARAVVMSALGRVVGEGEVEKYFAGAVYWPDDPARLVNLFGTIHDLDDYYGYNDDD